MYLTSVISSEGEEVFALVCSYEEKSIPKNRKLWWDAGIKKWITDDYTKVEDLIAEYADHHFINLFNKKQKEREDTEKESRATSSDIEIPAPEGLDYLPYQKAGISFCINRKNVLLADQMGCISGDAEIIFNRGGNAKIYNLRNAYKRFNQIDSRRKNWDNNIETRTASLTKDNELRLNIVKAILYKGEREVLEIITSSGKKLKLTPDHELITDGYEWKPVEILKPGDEILVNGLQKCISCDSSENIITYPYAKFKGYCKKCMYLQIITCSEHHKIHSKHRNFPNFVPKAEKIVSIKYVGKTDVYDIVMDDPHRNFVANGIIVHNCGKTIQAIGLINYLKLKSILIICPASLKINWRNELTRWLTEDLEIVILDSKKSDTIPEGNIFIINYDIVHKFNWLKTISWNLLICDECFPKGTLITTPTGYKKIEDIKAGDTVLNATGSGVVKTISKRNSTDLIKLYFSDKTEMLITRNHPIFTDNGWVLAANSLGHRVFTCSEIFDIMNKPIISKNSKDKTCEKIKRVFMSRVWKFIFSLQEKNILFSKMCCNKSWKERRNKKEDINSSYETFNNKGMPYMFQFFSSESFKHETFLRNILFSEMENGSRYYKRENIFRYDSKEDIDSFDESTQKQSTMGKRYFKKNERTKSFQTTRSTRENKKPLENLWSSMFSIMWRKWSRITISSTSFMGSVRAELENRISNKDGSKRNLPPCLQGRYCFTLKKVLDRSRWVVSYFRRKKKLRQKERKFSKDIRVERIESFEHRNRNKPYKSGSENSEGVEVFNIEVTNHPSYYANNILVHNCHYIKNHKTKRSKQIYGEWVKGKYKIEPMTADRKLMLTGTPILNRPIEIYFILKYLGFRMKWLDFVERYCDAKITDFGWDVRGSSNEKELQLKLRSEFMIRRLKKDVLKDLPPKRRQILEIPVEKFSKQIRQEMSILDNIKEIREELLSLKEKSNEDDYDNKAEELVQMQQTYFAELSKIRHRTALAKVPHIVEYVENLLEACDKIVIFAHHKDVIYKLVERFNKISVHLTGDTKTEDRQKAIDQFQNDPDIKIFFGTIHAAGVGITLTAASIAIFVELDWVPGNISQAEDRIHRIGQVDSVNITHIVIDGSIDSKLVKTLVHKQELIDQCLDEEIIAGSTHVTLDDLFEDDLITQVPDEPDDKDNSELKPELKQKILEGLKFLSSLCDGAHLQDGVGFSKIDVAFGRSLANQSRLTDKQAIVGRRILLKYHKQLDHTFVRELKESND